MSAYHTCPGCGHDAKTGYVFPLPDHALIPATTMERVRGQWRCPTCSTHLQQQALGRAALGWKDHRMRRVVWTG